MAMTEVHQIIIACPACGKLRSSGKIIQPFEAMQVISEFTIKHSSCGALKESKADAGAR